MMKLKRNQFKQIDFCKTVRKRYKRRFKKGSNLTDAQIMKVIKEYLEEVKEQVISGKKVMFDKHSYMRVVGVPFLEHPSIGLRKSGKYAVGNYIKKADNLSGRRGDFIFKIEYVNEKSKEKIYFNAHPDFSRKVRESIINTNTFYPIVTMKSNKDKITKTCN
jgi:hypothetical protein